MSLRSRAFLPESPPEVISKRIQELREAKGMSASELARQVGVTPTAVWNWEKNSIKPRYPVAEQIAKVLGVSTSFLLSGHGANREPDTLPSSNSSVATILEETKAKLVHVTGVPADKIKLSVHFAIE
jgi:transcriptional regulator with XRE-family HTH domain